MGEPWGRQAQHDQSWLPPTLGLVSVTTFCDGLRPGTPPRDGCTARAIRRLGRLDDRGDELAACVAYGLHGRWAGLRARERGLEVVDGASGKLQFARTRGHAPVAPPRLAQRAHWTVVGAAGPPARSRAALALRALTLYEA